MKPVRELITPHEFARLHPGLKDYMDAEIAKLQPLYDEVRGLTPWPCEILMEKPIEENPYAVRGHIIFRDVPGNVRVTKISKSYNFFPIDSWYTSILRSTDIESFGIDELGIGQPHQVRKLTKAGIERWLVYYQQVLPKFFEQDIFLADQLEKNRQAIIAMGGDFYNENRASIDRGPVEVRVEVSATSIYVVDLFWRRAGLGLKKDLRNLQQLVSLLSSVEWEHDRA